MEILGVRKWIFERLSGVFSAILVGISKNMQKYVHFFNFFLQIFCRYSLFVSPGRDQLLGKAAQKNVVPVSAQVSALSPLHEFWICHRVQKNHVAVKAGFYRKAVEVCYIPIPTTDRRAEQLY